MGRIFYWYGLFQISRAVQAAIIIKIMLSDTMVHESKTRTKLTLSR